MSLNGYEGYLFSAAMLLVILLHLIKTNEKHHDQGKIFLCILVTSIAEIILEALTWVCDGMPGLIGSVLVPLVNILQFLIAPLPLMFWVLFILYQIYEDRKKIIIAARIFMPVLLASTLLTLSTPLTGLYFFIDSQNIYHRGPLIGLLFVLCVGFFITGILLVLFTNRIRPFSKKLPLITFSLPPIVGIVLQVMFYGMRIMWGTVALSILIVYVYMQDRKIGTDYLTGLHNRRRLDTYLRDRIKSQQQGEIMGALFIDIDKFKIINDNFGHKVGDRALNATAKLLRKVCRGRDFIARYGGDEFVVIVDLKYEHDLFKIVERIREHCRIFNRTGNELFCLKLSIGSAIYKDDSRMTPEAFLSHLDNLMYLDKNKEAQGA